MDPQWTKTDGAKKEGTLLSLFSSPRPFSSIGGPFRSIFVLCPFAALLSVRWGRPLSFIDKIGSMNYDGLAWQHF